MIIFKVIYKLAIIYGQAKVLSKNTEELLVLLGINVTEIYDMVTGPEL